MILPINRFLRNTKYMSLKCLPHFALLGRNQGLKGTVWHCERGNDAHTGSATFSLPIFRRAMSHAQSGQMI
jgi:hypothetical protein